MKKNIIVICITSYFLLLVVCLLIYRNQKVKIVDLQTQLEKQKLVSENPRVVQKPVIKYIERRVNIEKIPDNIRQIIAENDELKVLLESFREKEIVIEGEKITEPLYSPAITVQQRDNKFSVLALSPPDFNWDLGWYIGVGYKIIRYPDISAGIGWEFSKIEKMRVFAELRF